MDDKDYFGQKHSYIIELLPDDFDKKIVWKLNPRKNHGSQILKPVCGLVLFYAPWCGHCKAVKDEWVRAASIAGFCDFYAFNCEKHKNHISKIKTDLPELIRGYPTIVMYKNGDPSDIYEEERSASKFVEACTKNCGLL